MAAESAASNKVEKAQAPAPTADGRSALAEKLVNRFSMWSGAAGLIPIPLADIAAVGGVQLQMLRKLSELFEVPFSENMGKSAIAALVGAVIPATSAVGVASAAKGVPVIGTTIGVLSMPALSAGATYLIGKAFIQHFASGGTLLDFHAPDYREFIKEQADKLKSKVDAPASAAPQSGKKSAKTAAPDIDR